MIVFRKDRFLQYGASMEPILAIDGSEHDFAAIEQLLHDREARCDFDGEKQPWYTF
jgi:hypothetical protein